MVVCSIPGNTHDRSRIGAWRRLQPGPLRLQTVSAIAAPAACRAGGDVRACFARRVTVQHARTRLRLGRQHHSAGDALSRQPVSRRRPAERHVRDGQARVRELGLGNIRIEQGDIAALELGGECFDYIVFAGSKRGPSRRSGTLADMCGQPHNGVLTRAGSCAA